MDAWFARNMPPERNTPPPAIPWANIALGAAIGLLFVIIIGAAAWLAFL